MTATAFFELKRNGTSRPVSAKNLKTITGQLALFRYKSERLAVTLEMLNLFW